MQSTRATKLSQIRKQLKNMTEQERKVFANRGIIATIDGRSLSLNNTMLCYMQSNANTPTIVGGYRQWHKAGRQVKKSEHGMMILFPLGHKEVDGEIYEAHTFWIATVFDISQTKEDS